MGRLSGLPPRVSAASLQQGVDALGEIEVGMRQTTLGVSGELEADLVPAVQQDVGMVVCPLGFSRQQVHEADRLLEVRELQLANYRLPLSPPLAVAQPLLDLVI